MLRFILAMFAAFAVHRSTHSGVPWRMGDRSIMRQFRDREICKWHQANLGCGVDVICQIPVLLPIYLRGIKAKINRV